MVALKYETFQIKKSATTTMRTGRCASTSLERHLIIKCEFHPKFQYPAPRWFAATGRRDIVRTGPGAKRA
jgi:hypothetical protein